MPAITSTWRPFMQEMARLDGVPPNMSVSTTTTAPVSTRQTASRISLRRLSKSSSGPIVTVSICFCAPTTCSSAARNSVARHPCVTRTRPIIQDPEAGCLIDARSAALSEGAHFVHRGGKRKAGATVWSWNYRGISLLMHKCQLVQDDTRRVAAIPNAHMGQFHLADDHHAIRIVRVARRALRQAIDDEPHDGRALVRNLRDALAAHLHQPLDRRNRPGNEAAAL